MKIDLLWVYFFAFLVTSGRNAPPRPSPKTCEKSTFRFSPNRQTTPVLAYEACVSCQHRDYIDTLGRSPAELLPRGESRRFKRGGRFSCRPRVYTAYIKRADLALPAAISLSLESLVL